LLISTMRMNFSSSSFSDKAFHASPVRLREYIRSRICRLFKTAHH
jgi:hypothetical protein